jgi:translation initiation factor IF-2
MNESDKPSMSNSGEQKKEPLTISRPGKLELTKTVEGGKVKQNFTHGRSKSVTVEVRKTRTFSSNESGKLVEMKQQVGGTSASANGNVRGADGLTNDERQARLKALQSADAGSKDSVLFQTEFKAQLDDAPDAPPTTPSENIVKAPKLETQPVQDAIGQPQKKLDLARPAGAKIGIKGDTDAERDDKGKVRTVREEPRRMSGKLTINQAMGIMEERTRSLASIKRAREKAKRDMRGNAPQEKVYREVVLPETITVQELANRMSERAVDVVRSLMKMGSIVTVNQVIDADTAELIVEEFGHTVRRVTDSDVENVLKVENELDVHLEPRAPVVTIMGHVDHGKTSLLDALRKTDVAAGEAGGITQHIGAYQVQLKTGSKITFLDTPGHEAFTAMRSRGAKVTDIVVLVVAADDGIMEQTKEAISHAKLAGVPIIVAVNKIDKPGADITRVKTELMSYELVPEEFGGETIVVPVSAKTGEGLDALEESILLQAEVLDLKANPNRTASGTVIESKVDKGRGVVASLLIQRGTLKIGDIVVAGGSYGRARAIMDDKNRQIDSAGPSMPVEILGLSDAPVAGDEFAVVENEKIAREITEFRQKKMRDAQNPVMVKTLESFFGTGEKAKELNLIVKADVHGSAEAISASIGKFASDEVHARVVHMGVGAISESDVTLAKATGGIIIGFNVRASSKAKEMAAKDKIDVRYYSIIYNVVEDIKAAISGLLSPTIKENFLGYAEIRQVFQVTKSGKVAGCMVTEGVVKRGAKVRLLRDNVVIHTGSLKTLKRFKDDAKEVTRGMECGMAFENYEDIREGDFIECFEVEEVARTI